MGEFRIGRTHAQHSYPDTPRGAGALSFARNFAEGPTGTVPITTLGVQIPWSFIESGAPAGANAPITPRVTGRMLFSGVVVVQNVGNAPTTLTVRVNDGTVTLLVPLVQQTVGVGEKAAVAFEILSLALFALGVTKNIRVVVTASADSQLELTTSSSTLEIEEKQFATG
jgi:hypothetical protein